MIRKIRVGLDFDGVVAYNPFRVVRAPVSYIKRNILGVKKLSFYYPKATWQQIFWKILHESSILPARGVDLLQILTDEGIIEAHLVTARYSFLDDHSDKWLRKYKLKNLFKTINLNEKDEQPHLFKEKIIKKHNLEIFIEDNLDIVRHLHGNSQAKIYWIYNLIDRRYSHPYKFPYLGKALEDIRDKIRISKFEFRNKLK